MNSFSEKSEKPTSKRLKKAKEEGEFAYSPKFAFAITFLATLTLLAFYSFSSITLLKEIFPNIISLMNCREEHFLNKISSSLLPLVKNIVLLILFIITIAFLAHGWQNHFFFSFKTGKKRNKRSSHRGYSLLYTLLSWTLLTLLAYQEIHLFTPSLVPASLDLQCTFLKKQLFFVLIKATLLFLFLSFLDYLAQKHFFYKDMHMTKEEIKEELKEERVAKYRK